MRELFYEITPEEGHDLAAGAGIVRAEGRCAITAAAGANGAVSPAGKTSVREGKNAAYAITPNESYKIADVLVDGVSVGAVSEYTFENVQKAHTIEAVFAWNNPFEDAAQTHWFYGDVEYACLNKLF